MVPEGLREAVDADSWALIALISACWAEYPGCVVDISGECPEMLTPATSFERQGGTLWVLPDGDWIAACVGLGQGREQPAELVKLYVARHCRGRGVGQALVGWVEHQARQQGATGIELWSDSRFHDAHRLYLRLGYHRSGAVRNLHDLSGTSEYSFHKLLPAD